MPDVPLVNKKMKQQDTFEYYLIKKVGKTIKKYGMLEKGDRVLVAVSGGKDSFTLLKILNDRRGFYPNMYEVLALHVASETACEGAADPAVLEGYLKEHGYPYRIVESKAKPGEKGPSPFWCAMNRRRVLFDEARRLGFNKLALGHHRNDVIETALMNMFYHAELSTMLPAQSLFEGRLTIIRPLYNIPESDTAKFVRVYSFPAVHCRCAIERETKREMFKRIVRELERTNPKAGVNALRSLENVRSEYLPGSVIKEDVVI
jgi:tRNA 2-thiocytidine biosynthesis protein TtcA